MPNKLVPGDPAPWFSGKDVTGAPVELHVDAGRWVVLAFLGSLNDTRAETELAALAKLAPLCDEKRLVIRALVTGPAEAIVRLAALSRPGLAFIYDEGGRVSDAYGARETPRTIVLDPMLRVVANVGWDHPAGHARAISEMLPSLPPVDEAAGVPLAAPVLILPRILDFALCDFLIAFYNRVGGDDSGFIRDIGGKSQTVVDHQVKRRQDLLIVAPELREKIRQQIASRLVPQIARYFQFMPTRIDRYLISCYDSAVGGHFFRHRDNINAGAQHRRLAVSLNLNQDYDGCDLVLPEFGTRSYRAPVGGAIVFSCGALHEVTPITRGCRYAFLPFLYGEADAQLRLANNSRLQVGEIPYRGDQDQLFPALAAE